MERQNNSRNANGVVHEDGTVTWGCPPHWGEMESGSYTDTVHIIQGGKPAALPNVGPGISDELLAKQNLTGKKGADAAVKTLKDRNKKKSTTS